MYNTPCNSHKPITPPRYWAQMGLINQHEIALGAFPTPTAISIVINEN